MPTLLGTAGADELRGDTGDDSIAGLDGPDTLNGLAGADTLDGGAGNDSLNDSSGSDLLLGGAGDDSIIADHRFSDSATVQNVTIDGGDGSDTIFVYQRTSGLNPPAAQETFTASILCGSGNDFVRLTGDFDATVNGGAGDDDIGIVGLWQKSVVLTLGPGADIVTYNPKGVLDWTGVVSITDFQAGNGGDRLLAPLDQGLLSNWNGVVNPFSDGHLRLVQQGADTVLQMDRDGTGSGFTFQDFVRFQNTSASAFTAFNLFDFAPSGSTAGPGTLTGTAGADQLNGGSGADVIQGLGGADVIFGDAGADTIDGGDGADTIDGGPGDDSVSGGAGNDVIKVLSGSDTVSGGDGADQLDGSGGFGGNVLRGDAGDDTLSGGFGGLTSATLVGGAGDDVLVAGGNGGSVLDGGDGSDTVSTGVGVDLITLGSGADIVTIASHSASAPISPSVSILSLDAITDWSAQDRLAFTAQGVATSGTFATETAGDLNAAVSKADADVAAGATFVAVQVGADVLVFADVTHNHFHAEEVVVLQSRSLSDISAGAIVGASGGTSPVGSTPTAGNDSLAATSGATEIHAGAGNDTIVGASVADYLRGDDGDDSIAGGSAFDDINGNMGNDTAHGNAGDDWVVGGKDNDALFGDAGDDIVWGNLGSDTLDGGDGNDQVRGGQGDDSVAGGAGNDFVSGDRGNDTISGGAGADTFHGSQDAGIDRVLDFHLSEGDRVMLDPGTTFTVSQVGADTVIDMGGGNQMILVGVQLSTLPPGTIFLG